jgi:heme/copper-type cytochrome/quinol oxidase subunit 2
MELSELLAGSMLLIVGVMVLMVVGAVVFLIWRMRRSKS